MTPRTHCSDLFTEERKNELMGHSEVFVCSLQALFRSWRPWRLGGEIVGLITDRWKE